MRLRALALAVALAAGAAGVHAGAQVEEPLALAVRTALSAAVKRAAPPPTLPFDSPAEQAEYFRWLNAMSQHLQRRLSEGQVRIEFLQTLWYESRRAGLAPELVLGLVQVESGFKKYAISSAGARGYMQVMPFWTRSIGDGEPARLFHMQTNLRFGCVILRHYLDLEKGDLFLALGRYNGSRGRAEYPNLVLGARKQWEAALAGGAAPLSAGPKGVQVMVPASPAPAGPASRPQRIIVAPGGASWPSVSDR